MKLEQSFEVDAPLDRVWAALNDLERVAPCLPGAALTDRDEDGTYHGEFQVKLGPTTASYRGQIRIEEADEATHTATLKARGQDKRGQGGAQATIVNRLSERDGGTRVEAVTDFSITGRLARFGRGGMIQDISNRLLREFASCLQERLGQEPAGAEASAEPAPVGASAEAVEVEAAPAGASTGVEVGGGPEAAAPQAAVGTDAGTAAPDPTSTAPAQVSASSPSPAPRPAFEPAPPLEAGSLITGVVLDRLRRPPVLGGILAVLALLLVLLRRRG